MGHIPGCIYQTNMLKQGYRIYYVEGIISVKLEPIGISKQLKLGPIGIQKSLKRYKIRLCNLRDHPPVIRFCRLLQGALSVT